MGGMLLSYESLIDIDKRNNTAVILEKYFWDMQGAEEYVSIVDTPPAVYKNLNLPDISQLNTIIPTKLLPIKDFIVNAKKYTKINQEIFPSALYDLHPIIDLIIAYDVAEILDAHRTYDSVDELNAVWLKILTRHQKEQMSITQSEEKTKLTGIDTSGLSVGMVVKNYKQLCEILKKETKTGNARKAQLKEFGRYFDWEKAGQKFIITDIYDTPLEKEDKRKFGNNSIYVRYIEVILLKYLSQQTGYTRTLTKRKWWELLGIVNSKYSRVSSKELEDLDYSVTAWEIKNFYQRCNKKLEEILFSALNSLKSRKLITYEIQTIIVKRDDKGREIYSEADDNEKKMLLDVEHYVLHKKYKPEYKDKSVCEEWLNYSNFKIWFDEHYVPSKNNQIDLDKDLLVQGNKVYSPETCVFLLHYQNTMFERSAKDKIYEKEDGTFVIGGGKKKTYATLKEAEDIVCERNQNRIESVAEKCKGSIPMCAYEAMLNWDVRLAMCS